MKQLALDLSPTPSGAPCVVPRYRVARDGLVEDLGETRIVYGFWERLFGCWRVDPETGRGVEMLPMLPILGARGACAVPVDGTGHPLLGDGAGLDPLARRRTVVALASYFATVPARPRRLVAPMGRYQWAALDLIWQLPGFAQFLDGELVRDHGQFVFACLALAGVERLKRRARRRLGAAMMRVRRHRLLGGLAGARPSRAIGAALARLGDGPCPAAVYARLVGACAQPAAVKALGHLNRLGAAEIAVLCALPQGARRPRLIEVLAGLPDPLALAEGVAGLIEKLPPPWDGRAIQALARVANAAALARWLDRWDRRRERLLPFPPPPIAAAAGLEPIASGDALRAEGRRMGNCLGTLVGAVLDGAAYFYRWTGPTPADVMIERDERGQWRLAAALAANNHPLDRHTHAYLRHIVQSRFQNAVLAGDDARCGAYTPTGRPTSRTATA